LKVLKIHIIIALLLCVANSTNAANGCYVSGTGRMYYQTPNGANTMFQGASFYVNLAQCSNGGEYFGNLSSTATNCWAVYDGSGSTTSSSNYLVTGKKATYTLLTCPIDTYSLLLVASIASLGFFFLRRMSFNSQV
jgi:hypothetical protein